jgi:gamma-glutamyltranspeptidase/glutathione hydrolase
VDAAVAAVATSIVTESPLTGLGAGGYMLVHRGSEDVVLDFFVAVPGAGGRKRSSELVPIPVYFTAESQQVFHIGAASCGVPGVPAGLVAAAERFGSVPLAELVAPAARMARDGVIVNGEQAFFLEILTPILTHFPEGERIYAPEGRILGEGDTYRFRALGDALERLGAEGAEAFYRGEVAAAVSDWVLQRGGTLAREDLATYEPVARAPVRAAFGGR